MSNIHEDVKFKFISFFCVAAQKLDMEKRYIYKNPYKSLRNEPNIEMLGRFPMPFIMSVKSRMSRR
jgi:hypothetical protein